MQLKADTIPCFSSGAGQLLSTHEYEWALFLQKNPICIYLAFV